MSGSHMLCALLPLLLAAPGSPEIYREAPSPAGSYTPDDDNNQLEGLCRTLAARLGDEVRTGMRLVDWTGAGWIIESG